MILCRTTLLISCLVLGVCGCETKSADTQSSAPASATNVNVAANSQPAASPASGPGFVDACSLN